MRRATNALCLAALCASTAVWLLPIPTHAQWPTSVRQNLPIAADTTLPELSPVATALADGAILTVFQKWWSGLCYQVTTRYGNPTYTPFASLSPATSTINAYDPKLVANPKAEPTLLG